MWVSVDVFNCNRLSDEFITRLFTLQYKIHQWRLDDNKENWCDWSLIFALDVNLMLRKTTCKT
ncbi:CLUMA_CG018645, isoform A [Clunio marinus]|uniref:CLUMA_CG018645, isoform A n=1 Tax=Clunio marinus TaxID=568069 RepID=A0A1J1J0T1_9DIPT|nr:CLUMA_CG018645, isoform A [Clunio marinus]